MLDLPDGWERVELGVLIQRIEAGLNVQCEERPPGPSERGLVKISAVTWGRFDERKSKTLHVGASVNERNLILPGDLLITRANTIELVGASVIVSAVGRALYLSDKVLRLVVDERHKRWINYALKTPKLRKAIEESSSGNQLSMRNISQQRLLALQISVPPAAEQQRIADKLDTVLARVDACRDRLARVAPLLKRFRQSVLAAATSGRLIDTRDEVKRVPLLQVVVEPLRNGKSVIDGHGAQVLRLSSLRLGGIDLAESKSGNWGAIDPDRFSIHAGDFLVSRGNGSIDLVGRGGLVINEPSLRMAFPDTMIRVRPNAALIDPKYLRAVWDSAEVRIQIESAARTTAGIYKISQGDLETLRVPLPSVAEQTEIVRRVESLFAYADRLEARLAVARTAVDRLTPALLAKAFRGELVPQDPNDEPAAELLRRLAESRQAAAAKPRRRQPA